MVDPSSVIDDFTGGAPRASEWRALRQALADRRRILSHEREEASDREEIAALDKQIAVMDRQIAALQTEEVVAKFVEESIEATLARAPEDLLFYEDEEDES